MKWISGWRCSDRQRRERAAVGGMDWLYSHWRAGWWQGRNMWSSFVCFLRVNMEWPICSPWVGLHMWEGHGMSTPSTQYRQHRGRQTHSSMEHSGWHTYGSKPARFLTFDFRPWTFDFNLLLNNFERTWPVYLLREKWGCSYWYCETSSRSSELNVANIQSSFCEPASIEHFNVLMFQTKPPKMSVEIVFFLNDAVSMNSPMHIKRFHGNTLTAKNKLVLLSKVKYMIIRKQQRKNLENNYNRFESRTVLFAMSSAAVQYSSQAYWKTHFLKMH